MERGGYAIPTATPTFSAMPDLDMALPSWPDIDGCRKPEMSATEQEVETGSGNNYERKELAMRFQRRIPYFQPCKLKYGNADTARGRPISVTQNVYENRK